MNKKSDYTLLPQVEKIAATTMGADLISVKPMGYIDEEKVEKIENRIKAENRDNYLDSILSGSKFELKRLQDDNEFKELSEESLPKGMLMYLDYKYNKNDK